MNIENWDFYYKIHETENRNTTTQMCYEPRVNPEKNVFCMNFCFPSSYQINQPRLDYSKDFVNFMFERELKYLEIFKNKKWAPEILDIDCNKIFIKWYGKTCNDDIYKTNIIDKGWYSHIEAIVLDQVEEGYLKSTVYPHSHYYDDSGQMHAIDFYATVEKNDPFLPYEKLKSLVGTDTDRFEKSKEGDLLNIENIFKSGLLEYSKWPDNLTGIYQKIYG